MDQKGKKSKSRRTSWRTLLADSLLFTILWSSVELRAFAFPCEFEVYFSGRTIECDRRGIESQICSFLSSCPSVRELNEIMKALYSSQIIGKFEIEYNGSVTVLRMSPNLRISKVHVEGDISQAIIRRVKDTLIGEKFGSERDVERFCEEILIREGVIEPTCSVLWVKSDGTEISLSISGRLENIRKINVEVDDEAVRDELMTKLSKYEGKNFFPALVRNVKRDVVVLAREFGYMNSEVGVSFSSETLTVSVVLGRKYAVFIQIDEGISDVSDDRIRKELIENFHGDFSPSAVKLFLENHLRALGIHMVSVSVSEFEIDENVSVLKIQVSYPRTYYLRELRIEGLRKLGEDEVKKHIGLKEKGLLSFFIPRYALYHEEQIRTSISKMYDLARSKGFFEFAIKDVRMVHVGDEMSVTVVVEEGLRAIIDNVYFLGFPAGVTESLKVSRTPMYYDRETIGELRQLLEKSANALGYSNCTVVVREVRKTKRLFDLYFIYVGDSERSFIKHILIDSKMDHRFIRDIGEVEEGMVIRGEFVDRTYNNLVATGYFDRVRIGVYPISSGPTGKSSLVILEMQEGKSNEVGISGGVSSVEGVRGNLEFTRRNMLNWGLDFSLGTRVAYWVFPFGRDMGLTFFGFRSEIARRKLFLKFDTSVGLFPSYESTFLYNIQKPFVLNINLSRKLADELRVMGSASFESRKLMSWQGFSSIPESANLTKILAFLQGMSVRRGILTVSLRNELILSSRLSDRVELASELYVMERLWGLGGGLFLGRLFSSDIFSVPVERRFFIGGSKGPRGYGEMSIYQDVSPRHRSDALNKALIMVELFSPKIYAFRTYIFFDTGTVFHDSQPIRLFRGVGPGMFLETSFGSFRLELGYGIDKNIFMVHFSLGLNKVAL